MFKEKIRYKIRVIGAEGALNQVSRIRDGLRLNGHIISTESTVDFIYCNDLATVDVAIEEKARLKKPLILNILDCPVHIVGFNDWVEKNRTKIYTADILTSISEYTRKQVQHFFSLDSTVIGNPIKQLPENNEERSKFAMSVGRLCDPNKRIGQLVYPVIKWFENKYHNIEIDFYGPENPGFGKYHGIVNDDFLSKAYHSHMFYLATSKIEGLCLPVIEAVVSGCIPIICNDMTTVPELGLQDFTCDPNPPAIVNKVIDSYNRLNELNQKVSEIRKIFKEKFNHQNVSQNIINTYIQNYGS